MLLNLKKIKSIGRHLLQVLCLGFVLTPLSLQADVVTSEINANALKAAMLYNITKYVRWPEVVPGSGSEGSMSGSGYQLANKSDDLGICILGSSPITDHLQLLSLRGKKVRGKSFKVYTLTSTLVPDTCNVLYINNDVLVDTVGQLNLVKQRPILTVSDHEGGAELGSMINFIPRGQRIGFEVNPAEAQNVNLVLTSELLRFGVLKSTLVLNDLSNDLTNEIDQDLIDPNTLIEQTQTPINSGDEGS